MNIIEQKVTISSGDPVTFIAEFEKAILEGARFKEGSYPRISQFPPMVELCVEGPADSDDWLWKSTAYRNCYPVDIVAFKYTKVEMEAMDWEDFRKVCSGKGVKGRDRAKMLKEYLEATGQQVAEKVAPTKE
ncbi:hypothetical protein D3C78_1220140 [compost metagenome]